MAAAPTAGAEDAVNVNLQVFKNEEDGAIAAVQVQVATAPESTGHYIFDVTMMATVTVQDGHANMPPEEYVTISGASLLYPFIREHVANLTMKGRFGAVWLRPFNLQAALADAKSTDVEETRPTGHAPRRRK